MKFLLKLVAVLATSLTLLTACGISAPEENLLDEEPHDLAGWHSLFERRDQYDTAGTSRSYQLEFDDNMAPQRLQKEGESYQRQVTAYASIENMLYLINAGRVNEQGVVTSGTVVQTILVNATAVSDLTTLPPNFVLDATVGSETGAATIVNRAGKLTAKASFSPTMQLDNQGKFGHGDATKEDFGKGQALFYRTPSDKLVAVVYYAGSTFDKKKSFYWISIQYSRQQFPNGIKEVIPAGGDYNFNSLDANLQPTNQPYGLHYRGGRLQRLQLDTRLKYSRDVTTYQGVAQKFYLACTITDLAVEKGYGSWQDNQVFLVRGEEQELTTSAWTDSSSVGYHAVRSCNAGLEQKQPIAPQLQKNGANLTININGVELAVNEQGGFAGDAIKDGKLRLFKTKIDGDWLLLYSYHTSGKNYSGLLTAATDAIVAEDKANDYSWSGMDKQGNTAMYAIIQRIEGVPQYKGMVPKWLKKQGDNKLRTVSRYEAMAGSAGYLLCLTDTVHNTSPVTRQQYANDTLLLVDSKRLNKINPNSAELGRAKRTLTSYNYCDLPAYKGDSERTLGFSVRSGEAARVWHLDAPESATIISDDGSFSGNGLSGNAEFYLSHNGLLLTRYQFSFTKDGHTQTGNGLASTQGMTNGPGDAAYTGWFSPDDKTRPNHWYYHIELNAATQPQWLRAGYPWREKVDWRYPKQPILHYQGIKNLAYIICSDFKPKNTAPIGDPAWLAPKEIKDRLYVNTEAVNVMHELGSADFSLEHGFTSCNAGTTAAVTRINYKKAVNKQPAQVTAIFADGTELILAKNVIQVNVEENDAVTYKIHYAANNGMWFEFYRTPANQWLVVYRKEIDGIVTEATRGMLTEVPPEEWISG